MKGKISLMLRPFDVFMCVYCMGIVECVLARFSLKGKTAGVFLFLPIDKLP